LKAGAFAQDRLLICPHGECKVIVIRRVRRPARRAGSNIGSIARFAGSSRKTSSASLAGDPVEKRRWRPKRKIHHAEIK
jgi:hypothetical protein